MKKSQWSQSPDWLAGNTALDTRLGIVYDDDPATTIESFVNASLGNQALEEIIADMPEIPALEYALKVSIDFSTNASSAVLGLGVASDTITLAEHHIYGSSRLGIQTYDTLYRNTFQIDTSIVRISRLSANKSYYSSDYGDYVKASYKEPWGGVDTGVMTEQRTLGKRYYEMTDHLGNVLATVMDRRSGGGSSGVGTLYSHWKADLASVQDLYPGGMMMPGRYKSMNNDTTLYRYGAQGGHKDNEIYGFGNWTDLGDRGFDSRTIRFVTRDRRFTDYPWQSPYVYAANNSILCIDNNGEGPRYKAIAAALESQLNSIGVSKDGIGGNTYNTTVTDNQIIIKVQVVINNEKLSKSFVFNQNTDDKGKGYNVLRAFGTNMYDAAIATDESWTNRMKWKVRQLDNDVKQSPGEGVKMTFSFWTTVLTFGEGAALLKGGSWLGKGLLALDLGMATNSLSAWFMAENQTTLEKLGISKEQVKTIQALNDAGQFLKGMKDLVTDAISNPKAPESAIELGKTIIDEINLMQSVQEVMESDN